VTVAMLYPSRTLASVAMFYPFRTEWSG